MKNKFIFSLIILIMCASGCGAGTSHEIDETSRGQAPGGSTEISFKEYEHDFGKVVEGEKVAYVFTFHNKGPGNLVITSALTSCGCTVPKYDTKPIPPGDGGSLEVVFDTSGRNGIQSKTISVKSNATTPVVILKITAEVIPQSNDK